MVKIDVSQHSEPSGTELQKLLKQYGVTESRLNQLLEAERFSIQEIEVLKYEIEQLQNASATVERKSRETHDNLVFMIKKHFEDIEARIELLEEKSAKTLRGITLIWNVIREKI